MSTTASARRCRTIRLVDYHVSAGGARCPHCQRRLCIRRGIRSWRALRALWFVAMLCMLPLFVLLAPVAFLLLPLFTPLLLAIGPLNALVHEPERCALCKSAVSFSELTNVQAEAKPVMPARIVNLQRVRRLRRTR